MYLTGKLLILLIPAFCWAQAPWTEEETKIIYKKVLSIFWQNTKTLKHFKKSQGSQLEKYVPETKPNAAKVNMNMVMIWAA